MRIYPMNKRAQEDEEDLLGQAITEELGLDKVHSADCIRALMEQPQFSGTNPKDWKRRSRHKDPQGRWVRLFENKGAGAKAEVIEVKGGLGVHVIQAPTHGSKPGITGGPSSPAGYNGILLIPPHTTEYQGGEDWTGRVVFEFSPNQGPTTLGLYCGPETTDGEVDDIDGGCDAKLEAIFGDWQGVTIGASECFHLFHVPTPSDKAHLMQQITQRLTAAGAVPVGSPPGNQAQQAGNPNSPIYYSATYITEANYEDMGSMDEDTIGKWFLCLTTKRG